MKTEFEDSLMQRAYDAFGPAPTAPAADSADSEYTSKPSKPRFVMIDEFCKFPPAQSWTIREYLEPDTIGVIYGESQSFKSFIVINLLCHIAVGKAWCGKKVNQGLCLYIAGEGGNGLSKRFRAWFEHHKEPMRNIAISTVPLELCDPNNADELIADIQTLIGDLGQVPLVIVLDTLSTHFGAGDENKTSEMRAFMQSIRKLRIATKATILIIHHVGHGNKERERGSISIAQDVDWRYRVERTSETSITTLINMKSRDAERPPPLSWRMESVPLPWVEDDGNGGWIPMSSLVPVPIENQPAPPKPEYLPKAQRIALDALRTALIEHGVEGKGVVSVAEDQWREAAYEAGISKGKQEAKRQAFVRTSRELTENGKVRCHEGRFWIPKPTPTNPDKPLHCRDMSTGCREGDPDKTRHIPIGMSGYVGTTDNPDISEGDGDQGWVGDDQEGLGQDGRKIWGASYE